MHDLTVLTPIKETKSLTEWYNSMSWLLDQVHWIVLDSGGGETLKDKCSEYISKDVDEWTARDILISKTRTTYTLNLDCFNILPIQYIDEALALLEQGKAEVCAIDYTKSIGHYGFGTSIWQTELLKQIYDYPPKALKLKLQDKKGEHHIFRYTICECSYIWNKLMVAKQNFIPLLYKAKNVGDPRHG